MENRGNRVILRLSVKLAALIGGILVLLNPALVPSLAGAQFLGFKVVETDHWPYPNPMRAPDRSVTPRPGGGDMNRALFDRQFEQVTVAEAQARLPFHVSVPSALPSGYRLASVIIPRGGTVSVSSDLQKKSSFVQFIYENPALQNPAHHHKDAPPNELPDLALVVQEAPSDSSRQSMVYAKPGTAEQLTLDNGHPALYLTAISRGVPGSDAFVADNSQNALTVEQDAVQVTISGYRGGGVDRTELIRIAVALR